MPGGPRWWSGRFRGCGYRLTVPRQAILEALTRTDKHLSAEDIYYNHRHQGRLPLAALLKDYGKREKA